MMGRNETRLGATFFIWLAFTVVMVALLMADEFNFIVLAILAGAAWLGTATVWDNDKDTNDEKTPEMVEKAKRRERIDHFLDDLNDDELDALRERLMSNSDGELVSVDELLYKVDERRR